MTTLRTCRAHELILQEANRPTWLIDELWTEQAVGITGGEPKCLKSFLALEMALAVATGRPCLRLFPVREPGPVLLYAAEDSLRIVHDRLQALAAGNEGPPLEETPLHVITEPGLRLDVFSHRDRLDATVQKCKPRLLVLDPFVRLHEADENQSGEIAPILGFLRRLQRQHQVAVLVVHHARKGGGRGRAGQELRGTSEFHAWGDSNLYLRRRQDELHLTTEHRSALGRDDLRIALAQHHGGLRLEVSVREPEEAPSTPEERVLDALTASAGPLDGRSLRQACRMRTQTLGDVLRQLQQGGRVRQTDKGYEIARAGD